MRDPERVLRPGSRVLALFGPTAVGKTAVAVALAKELRERGHDPVAVSADAYQVYRGLEVLSGAPSAGDRAELEHRLVGFVPIDATHDVARHAALAHAAVDEALTGGRTPIVVGGTGLYLRASLTDLVLRPPPDPVARAALTARLEREGAPTLHAELLARAPARAAAIAPNDGHRVVRALELLDAGEDPDPPDAGRELWTDRFRRLTLLAGLTCEAGELRRRIDARVDAMLAAGARDEVRAAIAAGASETARRAAGFAELERDDVDAMRTRTWQVARRQRTWLRKLGGLEPVDVTGRSPEEVAAELLRRWGA